MLVALLTVEITIRACTGSAAFFPLAVDAPSPRPLLYRIDAPCRTLPETKARNSWRRCELSSKTALAASGAAHEGTGGRSSTNWRRLHPRQVVYSLRAGLY